MTFNQLKQGHFYVSNYPGQGDYIFNLRKEGRTGKWLRYNPEAGETVYFSNHESSNFTPENGFLDFREALDWEIDWWRQCVKAKALVEYIPSVTYEIY